MLGVYLSHILTIKLQPGIRTWDTTLRYILAGLLPSSSASITLVDLIYRRSGFKALEGHVDPQQLKVYQNMQKAINAGAACVRVEQDRLCSGEILPDGWKIRADLRREDEVFVRIPRGTPAFLFSPITIEGSSQLMKALFGVIQLGFATMQLVWAAEAQVAAYGAFVYTIIPYAFGSIINSIGAILTDSYADITGMKLMASPAHPDPVAVADNVKEPTIYAREKANSSPPAEIVDDQTSLGYPGSVSIANSVKDPTARPSHPESISITNSAREGLETSDSPPEIVGEQIPLGASILRDRQVERNSNIEHRTIRMKRQNDLIVVALFQVGIFEFFAYLAIVGGMTNFHPGISSRAQRGWFMSWALLGCIYGLFEDFINVGEKGAPGDVVICQDTDLERKETNRRRIAEDGIDSESDEDELLRELGCYKLYGIRELHAIFKRYCPQLILITGPGVATIGGVVAMIQQYLHLFPVPC